VSKEVPLWETSRGRAARTIKAIVQTIEAATFQKLFGMFRELVVFETLIDAG
jgi:hypothetical protein